MIRRLALSLVLLAGVVLLGSCGKKTPTLNLLVWEGYADPSFVQGFEEQYHCKVSASYMGSSDELVAKLRGGSAGNYDVISPSSDVATSIAAAGLAAAARSCRRFPATASSRRSSLPCRWSRIKGQVYGVPFMWGPEPADLRHHGFPQASRQLDRVLGPEVSRQRFQCGTIFRPSTWPRRFSATTSPIRRSSTT